MLILAQHKVPVRISGFGSAIDAFVLVGDYVHTVPGSLAGITFLAKKHPAVKLTVYKLKSVYHVARNPESRIIFAIAPQLLQVLR